MARFGPYDDNVAEGAGLVLSLTDYDRFAAASPSVMSATVGVGPFVAVPHHRHGSDGFEPDVRVVAVHEGEEAAPDYRRAAGRVSDDVQHNLGRSDSTP
ncbi:hypothetical protein [Streptomyces massasporeus]|uniref:hypothetical protein n=1 Tax=Streptomyces massasporeus TaxID=67324 RepID=UPI0019924C0B|nr:hypothetical protein [Streptomyces massasporeus]GGV83139.1 hypothetical protein GCM10010228_59010 [Streptomyces massasporeus]